MIWLALCRLKQWLPWVSLLVATIVHRKNLRNELSMYVWTDPNSNGLIPFLEVQSDLLEGQKQYGQTSLMFVIWITSIHSSSKKKPKNHLKHRKTNLHQSFSIFIQSIPLDPSFEKVSIHLCESHFGSQCLSSSQVSIYLSVRILEVNFYL